MSYEKEVYTEDELINEEVQVIDMTIENIKINKLQTVLLGLGWTLMGSVNIGMSIINKFNVTNSMWTILSGICILQNVHNYNNQKIRINNLEQKKQKVLKGNKVY